jgi:hypothetical protein
MSNYAIVTRADNGVEYASITHPTIMSYAKRCNADFIILDDEPPVMTEDNNPHYRIAYVYDILEDYDRVILLDTDILVKESCPNLFDVVPEDKIGSIYEDVGHKASDRRARIKKIQQEWGDVGWETGYTNAGTMVVSKQHREIFRPHNGEYYLPWGSADLHLSYMIHKHKFEVHELPFQYNHMSMFSDGQGASANRFDSHIIHYAGAGIFDAPSRIEQIRRDRDALIANRDLT